MILLFINLMDIEDLFLEKEEEEKALPLVIPEFGGCGEEQEEGAASVKKDPCCSTGGEKSLTCS